MFFSILSYIRHCKREKARTFDFLSSDNPFSFSTLQNLPQTYGWASAVQTLAVPKQRFTIPTHHPRRSPIHFFTWISKVGASASNSIHRSCMPFKEAAKNNLCNTGTNNTSASNAAPAANAPTLHRLEPNPSFVMDSSPLQLNPWNKRVKDKVANAMVLAVLASVCKPIPKAASDAAPIKMP